MIQTFSVGGSKCEMQAGLISFFLVLKFYYETMNCKSVELIIIDS